jgi:hypothetical protein
MSENIDLNGLFENAKRDPSLFSTIDIQNLLDSIENERNDYLEDKTMASVHKDILEVLEEQELCDEDTEKYFKKLMEYRYVEEINELHTGKHIRWIRRTNNKLTNGGIIMDIKFMDTGTQILCRNACNKFIQIKFDECIIFQKLSIEEQLILLAYENADG